MFSTVMGVASLQIQARVLSTIVFSGSVLLQFSTKNRQPAFSCGIPFEISHDLVLTVSSLFSQSILENLELDCTPKFECNGAWIADATTSPVY